MKHTLLTSDSSDDDVEAEEYSLFSVINREINSHSFLENRFWLFLIPHWWIKCSYYMLPIYYQGSSKTLHSEPGISSKLASTIEIPVCGNSGKPSALSHWAKSKKPSQLLFFKAEFTANGKSYTILSISSPVSLPGNINLFVGVSFSLTFSGDV